MDESLNKVPEVILLLWIIKIFATTVGTMMADFADRSLGTMSVESVSSAKAEIFYWVTIMFSQTLGTALGDWTADSAGLGYAGGAVVFGALLSGRPSSSLALSGPWSATFSTSPTPQEAWR